MNAAAVARRITRLEHLAQLAMAASNDAVTSVYKWRPGGPTTANTYADFEKLYELARTDPAPRIVEFDDSYGPCVLPVRAYDWGAFNVEFRGAKSKGPTFGDFRTTLTIPNGVSFTNNPPFLFSRLDIVFQGLTPAIEFASGVAGFILRWSTFIESTNNVPFIRATGTSYVVVDLFDQSIMIAGYCLGSSGAGATMSIGGFDDGTLYDNTVQATGGASLEFFTYSSTASASTAQSGLPGGVIVPGVVSGGVGWPLQAAAEFIYYTQTTFPFLPSVDPTGGYPQLSKSLDALKNFIAGAEGAPLTDANATIALAGGYWRALPPATITANRQLRVAAPGANMNGQQLTITKRGNEAFTYAIIDDASGVTLYTFPASTRGYVKIQWNGAAWAWRELGTSA